MQPDRTFFRDKILASALMLLLAACATPNGETVATRSDEKNAAADAKTEPVTHSAPANAPNAGPGQKTNVPPAKIETLAQLADWEGRRPGVSGQAENLWDIPVFQKNFEKTIGKKYATEIVRGWDGPSQSKIIRQDDSLIFSVHKNHNGGENNAYIFISLKSNTLGVCLHKASLAKSGSSDLWMETGKKLKPLPADACAKYEQLFRR